MEELKNLKRCLSLNVVILLLGCVNLATPASMKGPVTNDVRKKFVIAHNYYRRYAYREFNGTKQPAAVYMRRVYWNAALEAEALSWSAQMSIIGDMVHGNSGVLDKKEFLNMLEVTEKITFIGQNLGTNYDNASELVQDWHQETSYYSMQTGKCMPNKKCGHYTQIMWADSFLVGCAFDQKEGKDIYSTCDYWPPGNWKDELPYKTGDTCSQCKTLTDNGFTECDDGLCQPKDKCAPVKECKVVDTENCLCSEADYKEIVARLMGNSTKKANGLRLAPSSPLLLFSVAVGLFTSPL